MVQRRREIVARARPAVFRDAVRRLRCPRDALRTTPRVVLRTMPRTGGGPACTPRGSGRCSRPRTPPTRAPPAVRTHRGEARLGCRSKTSSGPPSIMLKSIAGPNSRASPQLLRPPTLRLAPRKCSRAGNRCAERCDERLRLATPDVPVLARREVNMARSSCVVRCAPMPTEGALGDAVSTQSRRLARSTI